MSPQPMLHGILQALLLMPEKKVVTKLHDMFFHIIVIIFRLLANNDRPRYNANQKLRMQGGGWPESMIQITDQHKPSYWVYLSFLMVACSLLPFSCPLPSSEEASLSSRSLYDEGSLSALSSVVVFVLLPPIVE